MFPAFNWSMSIKESAVIRRGFWVVLLLLSLTSWAKADEWICPVCGQPIHHTFYDFEDRVEHVHKKTCETCSQLKERCFICSMPVLKDYKTLSDGRFICARDSANIIESEADA